MSKQTAEEIARIATNELVKDITDHPECLTNNEGEGHTLWEIVNQHIESAMHQYASQSPGWVKGDELDKIERLEKIVEIKENERQEWYRLCMKKTGEVQLLHANFVRAGENIILGNAEEVHKIVTECINYLKYKP